MSMIKCPECGNRVSTMAGTCPTCGVAIHGHLIHCEDCGTYYLDRDSKCPYCGKEAPAPQETPAPCPPPPEQPSPHHCHQRKNRHRTAWRAAGMAFFLLVAGGASVAGYYYYFLQHEMRMEQERYEALENLSEPVFFEQFLADFPLSEHQEEVKARLQQIKAQQAEWAKACQGDRATLQAFLDKHPDSFHAPRCAQLIDSIDWQQALADTTGKGIDHYLELHPEGMYADVAAKRKNDLAKAHVSTTEKSMILGMLDTFFNQSMQSTEEEVVAQAIVQPMESFCGKKNATAADIIQYVKKKKTADVIGLHYVVSNTLSVRRESVSDGSLGYHVECTVDETVSRSDTTKPTTHCYKVSCRLTADRQIVQMSIR